MIFLCLLCSEQHTSVRASCMCCAFACLQNAFMAHFGLGSSGAGAATGWTEDQLRQALISVIENQADEANAAADVAPL
jgi:hypothetical protein